MQMQMQMQMRDKKASDGACEQCIHIAMHTLHIYIYIYIASTYRVKRDVNMTSNSVEMRWYRDRW